MRPSLISLGLQNPDNLMIHSNLIEASHQHGVQELLYLMSSRICRATRPQPIAEEQLLTGSREPTNEAYPLAKTSGMKLCDD